MVTTEDDHTTPIAKVKTGDRIWSANPITQKSGYHGITQLSTEEASDLVDVVTSDRQTIEATPATLFWVSKKGWISAKSLFPGDQLMQRNGGFTKVFNVLPKHVAKTKIYNLGLKDVRAYGVGRKGILVSAITK